MATIQYLVTVDVDTNRLMEDNPPENIAHAIRDEIKSNLEYDNGLAITHVEVIQVGARTAISALTNPPQK